jgi:hypothetical protein
MASPSTLTINYASSSTATVPIISGAGGGGASDYAQMVQNIVKGGGVWTTSSAGVLTWIPLGEITSITAQ